MSPFLKRTVYGIMIALNTGLFGFSLIINNDVKSALINLCVCVVSWVGIHFVNAAEQLENENNQDTEITETGDEDE